MHSNQLDSARFQFISPAHARYWASGTMVLDPQKKKKRCRYHCRYVRTAAASPLSLLLGLHICTLGVHKARCGEQFQANSMCNLQVIFTPLHCLLLICGNLASEAADSAASPIPKEVHAAHLVSTSCPTYAKGARRCRVHGRVPRNKTQDAMHPNVSA